MIMCMCAGGTQRTRSAVPPGPDTAVLRVVLALWRILVSYASSRLQPYPHPFGSVNDNEALLESGASQALHLPRLRLCVSYLSPRFPAQPHAKLDICSVTSVIIQVASQQRSTVNPAYGSHAKVPTLSALITSDWAEYIPPALDVFPPQVPTISCSFVLSLSHRHIIGAPP